MANFKLEQVPLDVMYKLGLHDGENFTIDQESKNQLLMGNLTKFQDLKDVNIDGVKTDLQAKLSLRQKDDGSVSLRIHPIYNTTQGHSLLNDKESTQLRNGGTISKSIAANGKIADFGKAPYEDNPKNDPSFFIELEKSNGDLKKIWGVDLNRALEESGHKKGDLVQLQFLGRNKVEVDVPVFDEQHNEIARKKQLVDRNEWLVENYNPERKKDQNVLFEFDPDTNSFVSIPDKDLNIPEEVNGEKLTQKMMDDLRAGREIEMINGTKLKMSPASENGILSNRNVLILSLFLDGGLSFMILKAVQAITKLNKEKQEKQTEQQYNQGYMDALDKVYQDLSKAQNKFPMDKNIDDDIKIVKDEIDRVNTSGVNISAHEKASAQSDLKAKINDPEIELHAEEHLKEDLKINGSDNIKGDDASEINREQKKSVAENDQRQLTTEEEITPTRSIRR